MAMMKTKTQCASCGAPIFWARTVNRKMQPIDFEPAADGNLAIDDDGIVHNVDAAGLFMEHERYKTHFATCPNSPAHRKPSEKPTRQCPFANCKRRIEPEKFCCWLHWKLIAKEDQQLIWEAYRRWRAGDLGGDELRRIQREVVERAKGVKV